MGKTDKRKNDARVNKTVRLSAFERRCLEEGAKEAGVDESKYIRLLILHGGADKDNLHDRQRLIRQISGVATNINQVVHRINGQQSYYFSDGRQLKEELSKIQALMKEMLELWR